jgi:hypothetical protein
VPQSVVAPQSPRVYTKAVSDASSLTVAAREFPESVHRSLAELRAIAKAAKSKDDPLLRWGTEAEIALSEALRKPWHCLGHSSRTGLACAKPRIQGASVCTKHGASAKHVRMAADQRLAAMALPMIERTRQLAMQHDSPAVAQKAAADLLDRGGIGAVVQAKIRESKRRDGLTVFASKTQVFVGMLNPMTGADGTMPASPDQPAFTEHSTMVVWHDPNAFNQAMAARQTDEDDIIEAVPIQTTKAP